MGWGEFEGPLFEYLEGLTPAVPRLIPHDRKWPKGWRPNARGVMLANEQLTAIRTALAREATGFHLTLEPTGGWGAPLGALRKVDDLERVGAAWNRAVNHAAWWMRERVIVGGAPLRAFECAAFTHRADPDGWAQLHTHIVIPRLQPHVDGTWHELDDHGLSWHALGAQAVADAVFRYALTLDRHIRASFAATEPDGVIAPVDRAGNVVTVEPVWIGGPEARWAHEPGQRPKGAERRNPPFLHRVLPARPGELPAAAAAPEPDFADELTADERVAALVRTNTSGFKDVHALLSHPAIRHAAPGTPERAAPVVEPHPTLGDLHTVPALDAMKDRAVTVPTNFSLPADVRDARAALFDAARDVSYFKSLGFEPRWIRAVFARPKPEALNQRRPIVEKLMALGPNERPDVFLLNEVLEHRQQYGPGQAAAPSETLNAVHTAEQLLRTQRDALRHRRHQRAENLANQQSLFD